MTPDQKRHLQQRQEQYSKWAQLEQGDHLKQEYQKLADALAAALEESEFRNSLTEREWALIPDALASVEDSLASEVGAAAAWDLISIRRKLDAALGLPGREDKPKQA